MLTSPQSGHAADPGCDATRTESFAACDGELTSAQLAAIDAHLERCSTCRARFAADATFLHAVRRAAAIDTAPASLRDRVSQLLQSHATENAPT
jgi:mycothiol system anti-sigma-R factor